MNKMFSHRTFVRLTYTVLLLGCTAAAVGLVTLLQSKQYVFEQPTITVADAGETTTPFPVSVNPILETIDTRDQINLYPSDQLAVADTTNDSWWDKILAAFSQESWYQNLASPVSRIVVIWPGERKEEAAKHIGEILRWDSTEREEFTQLITSNKPIIAEGKFYPGRYVTHRGASPSEMASVIAAQFENEILSRYTDDVAEVVPLEDALIIASLLEREASDFENMREVSGVIWNRLFIDMPLQLDATLQYVRGARPNEESWWPVPHPRDKFLDSPYNTYSNEGLPPGPIANPSSEAVLAALNPIPTDCFYYFHDANGGYHCSQTYEEHVTKLKATYGRGR